MKTNLFKKYLKIAVILLTPVLLSIYNFPFILFGSRYLFGYPSDKLAAVWDSWWRIHAGSIGQAPNFVPFVDYPWGVRFSGDLEQTGYVWFRQLLANIISGPMVFNTIFVLVVFFAFISIYHLVVYLTRSRLAGFFSGVVFATGQSLVWHAAQNIELSVAASLLPFLLETLFRLEESLNGRLVKVLSLSVFAGLLFTIIIRTSYYVSFFTLLFILAFFLIRRGLDFKAGRKKMLTVLTAYFALVSTAVILNGQLLWLLIQFWQGSYQDGEGALMRALETRNSLNDLIAYGARPWDYLMPSSTHPVFGSLVTDFYQYLRGHTTFQFWGTFLPERPNYLTFTALALAAVVVGKVIKDQLSVVRYQYSAKTENSELKTGDCKLMTAMTEGDRRTIITLALLALAMFLVSLPPVVTIRGWTIYFPSFILFKIVPQFRVYARAGIFVYLGVAVLAGFGLSFISKTVGSYQLSAGRKKALSLAIPAFFTVMVLFENLNWPPVAAMDVESTPRVYQWLKDQKDDLLVVEYPRDNSGNDLGGGCPAWLEAGVARDYNHAYELFYYRFHQKKLFGVNLLPPAEKVAIGDLSAPETYNILKRYGVTTIVVHTKDPMIGTHPFPYPQENPLDECWQRRIMKAPEKVYEKFVKVAEFDDGAAYKLD